MSEQARRASNRDRALELLQTKGLAGATNAELLTVAGFRYGARLHDLRRQWVIDAMPEGDGLWRFTLRGPRQPGQQELFR